MARRDGGPARRAAGRGGERRRGAGRGSAGGAGTPGRRYHRTAGSAGTHRADGAQRRVTAVARPDPGCLAAQRLRDAARQRGGHRSGTTPPARHHAGTGTARRPAPGACDDSFHRPARPGRAAAVTSRGRHGAHPAAVPVPQAPAVQTGQTARTRRHGSGADPRSGHRIRFAAGLRPGR